MNHFHVLMNVHIHIETDSRKWALNDVTKCFLFHKKAISTKRNVSSLTSLLQFSWRAACIQRAIAILSYQLCMSYKKKWCQNSFHHHDILLLKVWYEWHVSESLEHWKLNIIIASTSELQPGAAIANQLPDHLFSTKIRAIRLNSLQHW